MLPPVITLERADELDAEEIASISALSRKGKRRHFAAEPCLRVHGPFRPNIVCDPDAELCTLNFYDAATFSSEPVAVFEFPARVPLGFHSNFVPEDQLQEHLQKHGPSARL